MYSEQFETSKASGLEIIERIRKTYKIDGKTENGFVEYNLKGVRIRVNSRDNGVIKIISSAGGLTISALEVSKTLSDLSTKLGLRFSFIN